MIEKVVKLVVIEIPQHKQFKCSSETYPNFVYETYLTTITFRV